MAKGIKGIIGESCMHGMTYALRSSQLLVPIALRASFIAQLSAASFNSDDATRNGRLMRAHYKRLKQPVPAGVMKPLTVNQASKLLEACRDYHGNVGVGYAGRVAISMTFLSPDHPEAEKVDATDYDVTNETRLRPWSSAVSRLAESIRKNEYETEQTNEFVYQYSDVLNSLSILFGGELKLKINLEAVSDARKSFWLTTGKAIDPQMAGYLQRQLSEAGIKSRIESAGSPAFFCNLNPVRRIKVMGDMQSLHDALKAWEKQSSKQLGR